MQLWETGLMRFEMDQLLPKADKCFTKTDNKLKFTPRPTPIKLEHLGGAFLILGIGFCLVLLCFFIEKIAHVYQHHGRADFDRRKMGLGCEHNILV